MSGGVDGPSARPARIVTRPIGAGCREVGADVASRAVESKAAAHPPILDHKRESDVTEVTSAAPRSTYLSRKKDDGLRSCVGTKSYQDLTQPADRRLNPSVSRADQRANGAAEKTTSRADRRHDRNKHHSSDTRCSPSGSCARRRPRRPLAHCGQSPVRPLPAGAALYARSRAKMACQT